MTHISRRPAALLVVVSLVAGLLVVLAPALAPVVAPQAQAADASDWDPGYIIDDSIFYSSNDMNASDVQNFLNGKVRSCRSGYTCLKDYSQSTDNRPSDRYCNGYSGSASETAAQIIDKVARSCGINQRALLVLLEKEQSLVTSTAPSSYQYSAAMGQGCPDTAPCDPGTRGFFYQVYYSARQFEVYRLNPDSFGYRAQRWNNILYNPDSSCGTRSVFINNQATAGLYIYTPYTPNAAALNNLYGTGDACSAYGNRNFWRIYTDWFGDTRSYAPHPGFVDYWNSRGGAGGEMGKPTSYPVFVDANGQGWYQRFEKGVVYGSYYGGTAFVFNGPILDEYLRNGGPASGVSWPNAESTCSPASRCVQSFVGATITSTTAWGGHVIWGGLNDYWKSQGGLTGPLGAALNDVAYRTAGSQPAWIQNFEAGVLVQNPAGIFVVPYGPVLEAWQANGGGENWLGWPTSGYQCSNSGCAQRFAGGVITWSNATGAKVILGGFISEWDARGGLSKMGPATTDLRTSNIAGGGWVQAYTGGILAQSSYGMMLVPTGPQLTIWNASSREKGWLGWPKSQQRCVASGCGQDFAGATLTTSETWGTHSIFGGLGGAWSAAGGLNGYGVALNDLRYTDTSGGGWVQHYQTGVITQQRTGSSIYTAYGPILNMWYHYGAENTWLGWPSASQSCTADGCIQQFQRGVARSDRAGNVSFLPR